MATGNILSNASAECPLPVARAEREDQRVRIVDDAVRCDILYIFSHIVGMAHTQHLSLFRF